MDSFAKYAQLRDEGKSPEEVYAIAKPDGLSARRLLTMLQRVFDLASWQVGEVTGHSGGVSYSQYKAQRIEYQSMRDGGTSPHDVCLIAIAAGLSDIQQIRMLREVFDLSLVEAKEVMVVASGLGTSLDDYQARLIPSLLDAFAADDAEEE